MSIIIEHLTRRFGGGVTALNDVSVEIGDGMFGLLGPNGAGKTTLMRVIATLLPATCGRVTVNGYDIRKEGHLVRAQLGYLPQEYGLPPDLTAYEFLDFMACLHGMADRRRRRQAVEACLERVNLSGVAHRRIRTFSGGMKQRLGIAQALVADPRVLIVDEPTAGLDPEERLRFRSLLSELSPQRTVILSTHIVQDISASCAAMGVLHRGKIEFAGHPRDLISRVSGKVWQVQLEEAALARLKACCTVVSTMHTADCIIARVISDVPPTEYGNVAQTEASLEDAYIYLVGGEHRYGGDAGAA